ncbi:MAG: 50S ribosomal protein L28 [Rickettsiales bacterium]|jgi:large subunit ribosomal protein L28|nr:50S ribosomal protein L28 [Rickettsiales bacterium]
MTRQCAVTGKKRQIGCNVSHSMRHTKKTFLPNTKNATFRSDLLKKDIKLTVSAQGLRTIEKNGGIDAYLLKSKNGNLNETLKKVKAALLKVSPFKKEDKKEVRKVEVKKRVAKIAAKKTEVKTEKKVVAKKAK